MKNRTINKFSYCLLFLISISIEISHAQNTKLDSTDFKLCFEENFDSDLKNWEIVDRWERSPSQDMVMIKENVEISDGILHLKATANLNQDLGKKFYGAEVYSKEKFKYGYFEARVNFPKNVGYFPAVWLFPFQEHYAGFFNENYQKSNFYPQEIDIIEQRTSLDSSDNKHFIYTFIHYFWNKGLKEKMFVQKLDTNTNWHICSLKWTPKTITWYLDGHEIGNVKIKHKKRIKERPVSIGLSMQILINHEFKGFQIPQTSYSKIEDENFQIDWVKVYKLID